MVISFPSGNIFPSGIFLIIDGIRSENHGWEWELIKTQDKTMVGNEKIFPVVPEI